MEDVALNIDKLLTMLKQQYQLLQMEPTPVQDGFLTISRVRELTRNVRPNEYTPHYVPIGPYHWSSSSQRRIAEKSQYLAFALDAFSKRTGDNFEVLLRKLLQEMKTLGASSCYSDRFGGMGAENEFLHIMLLLDGCYLLTCFVGGLHREPSPSALEAPQQETRTESATGAAQVRQVAAPAATTESAGVSSGSGDVESASGDVDVKVRETFYLLENQIPFFVVQRIYDLVTGDTPTNPSAVLTIFSARVKKELQDQLYISATAEGSSDPSHLLHLVRTYFPPPQVEGGHDASLGTGRWRRATEYCSYANVRFHPQNLNNGAASSVLDVSLAGGALLVPLLRVDNNTWTILRNLMALEEHDALSLMRHVTAYCLFMSQLACTEEDVALLVRRRVVEHFLGSDAEVAAGFADLCKGVVLKVDDVNSNYLKPVWHELEWRYWSRWHNLVAWFRQTHCRNPWYVYVAAFLAAVILFASQVVQGLCTLISCKK